MKAVIVLLWSEKLTAMYCNILTSNETLIEYLSKLSSVKNTLFRLIYLTKSKKTKLVLYLKEHKYVLTLKIQSKLKH